MFTQTVGGMRILNTTGALAKLSRRSALGPGLVLDGHSRDHAVTQRAAVVDALVQGLDAGMKPKFIGRFDKSIMVDALKKANGFDCSVGLSDIFRPDKRREKHDWFLFNLRCFVTKLDASDLTALAGSSSNLMLDMVIDTPCVLPSTLEGLAMINRQPALTAFNRMEKSEMLSSELLDRLSRSEDIDVIRRVAESSLTTTDTLINIIASYQGASPLPTKAVAAAMENLFSRDGVSFSFDRVARLETSPNPFVQSTVNTLLGKDVRRLVAMALSQDPMAKCALIKLREARLLEPEIQVILERYNRTLNEPYYVPEKGKSDIRTNILTEILEELFRNEQTPRAIFEALVLMEGDIAESAYYRLAGDGCLEKKTLSILSQSRNACVLEQVISHENSDPCTVAVAISRIYQIRSSKIGAKFRAEVVKKDEAERSEDRAQKARDEYSHMKGLCVSQVVSWIRSRKDAGIQKQIVEGLSNPQLKNDVEILLGKDVNKLTIMALESKCLSGYAVLQLECANLLSVDVLAALKSFSYGRDIRRLDALLDNPNTPLVVFEHLALLNDGVAVHAYDRLESVGQLDEKMMLTLSKSANQSILEKVACNSSSSPAAIGTAISGYCRIKAAEWSAMTKKKASKKEKQAIAKKRSEDIAQVVKWIRLRIDPAVQRQILFYLSDIHPKTEKQIRSAVMGEPKGKD